MLEYIVKILEQLQQIIRDMGGLGIFAFIGIFVVAQMLVLPVSPLGLASGFFFGFMQGWLGLMLACVLGAAANFLVSRHVARDAVSRWLSPNEKFRLIDSAIGRGGLKIIILLRFVPVPFGAANYAFGLTPVRFWQFLGGTCLAIIPANTLFTLMGSTFQGEIASLVGKGRPHHPLEYVFLVAGIVAAILALRYVAKVANAAVASAEAESP